MQNFDVKQALDATSVVRENHREPLLTLRLQDTRTTATGPPFYRSVVCSLVATVAMTHAMSMSPICYGTNQNFLTQFDHDSISKYLIMTRCHEEEPRKTREIRKRFLKKGLLTSSTTGYGSFATRVQRTKILDFIHISLLKHIYARAKLSFYTE